MAAQAYEFFGLSILSEVALPEDVSSAGPFQPDILLRLGESRNTTAALSAQVQVLAERAHRYCLARDRDGYICRFYGMCDFSISLDLRVVTAHADPAADAQYISVLFAGNVLSALLALRGEFVLHASAVELGGRALAIVGASGMGKSTLAAQLCAHGATLVTDDVLRLREEGRQILCLRGTSELRLRQVLLEFDGHLKGCSVRQTCDGRRAVRVPRRAATLTPLAAIVLPRVRECGSTALRRLNQQRALVEMLRYPRVAGWLDAKMRERMFQATTKVARAVPVWEADIPVSGNASDLLKLIQRECLDLDVTEKSCF